MKEVRTIQLRLLEMTEKMAGSMRAREMMNEYSTVQMTPYMLNISLVQYISQDATYAEHFIGTAYWFSLCWQYTHAIQLCNSVVVRFFIG